MRRTRSLARLLFTIATAGVWVGWLEARSGAVTSIHAASQPPARLGISFEVAPPGGPFKTYVTGVNTRVSTP